MKEYNGDGYDCTCRAQCESECCCGADWTDSEIYELREELADYLKWYKQDKAEIAKLKNERDLWIDRAEQLWSMYERDAPTPHNSVTWFDDMGAAKRGGKARQRNE